MKKRVSYCKERILRTDRAMKCIFRASSGDTNFEDFPTWCHIFPDFPSWIQGIIQSVQRNYGYVTVYNKN